MTIGLMRATCLWKKIIPPKGAKKSQDLFKLHGISVSSIQPNTEAQSSQICLSNTDVNLSPQLSKRAYGVDEGSYQAWCPIELAMLEKADIGATKLALKKNELALPSYSNSAKIAYVLQGTGICGMVLPEATKEKVLPINEGGALALPFGVVTWWFNSSGSELVVLFLGDTSKGHKRHSFIDLQITGSKGIFMGFTPEFVEHAWDLSEEQVNKLLSSQTGCCIVKVKDGQKMPDPVPEAREGMIFNCLEVPGGRVVKLNTENLPLVGKVGLGLYHVRIDGFSMFSDAFCCDPAHQVVPCVLLENQFT